MVRYNSLVDASGSDNHTTSVAEILAGEFPWSALIGMYVCTLCCIACHE